MASWDWGDLRRSEPFSREFGIDRGQPIDRYYIEAFLKRWHSDIGGRTLEAGDDEYTRRFGGDRTTRRDVLHVHDGNPRATIVGDLVAADHIPAEQFDCLVLTQTLHFIYDLGPALATIHRILRPAGAVLATFPGISQVSIDEWSSIWAWGISCSIAERLFGDIFGAGNVTVCRYGNTLAAACFLQGMAASELTAEQLDFSEPDCEMLIGVRAVKQRGSGVA